MKEEKSLTVPLEMGRIFSFCPDVAVNFPKCIEKPIDFRKQIFDNKTIPDLFQVSPQPPYLKYLLSAVG